MDFGIWSHSGKSLIEARIRCLDVRPVSRETGGTLLRTTVAHASSLSLTGRLLLSCVRSVRPSEFFEFKDHFLQCLDVRNLAQRRNLQLRE